MQTMIRKQALFWVPCKRRGRGWAGLLAAAAIAVSFPGHAPGSDDSAQPSGQSANATTVPLEYREIENRSFVYDLLFRDVHVQLRSSPFPKEPAPVPGKVVRGLLKFGNNPSNAVPFLWQPGEKKLFLDVNRKQDLTAEAAGVFSGSLTGPRLPGINHQVFTNVHLSFPGTSAGAPIMLDLNFFQNGESGLPMVNAMGRSFWEGKVTVAGKDWEVGLVQNLSDQPGSFERGQLLLRPWEERDKQFYAWSGSVDSWAVNFEYKNRALKAAHAFEFSRRVFFEGHAWRLDWDTEPKDHGEKLALRFTEEQPALGELKLAGRFIERMILTGGPYAVVLVRPDGSVKVPVGSYKQPTIWLKQSQTEAYFDSLPKSGKHTVPQDPRLAGVRPISGVEEAGKVVVVDELKPMVLAMGGPLTNSVSVVRDGQDLHLSYRLIGVGGEEYKIWEYWRSKPGSVPQFAVYQGDKNIASGKFAFG
jgi:hypothetical protein